MIIFFDRRFACQFDLDEAGALSAAELESFPLGGGAEFETVSGHFEISR